VVRTLRFFGWWSFSSPRCLFSCYIVWILVNCIKRKAEFLII